MREISMIMCIGAIRRVGVRIWGIGRVVRRLMGRVMGGIVRRESLRVGWEVGVGVGMGSGFSVCSVRCQIHDY